MTPARLGLAILATILGAASSAAQPKEVARVKEPPRAEKLDIQIRYRIRADRDERIRQHRALEKHLAALGFVDARKDDPDRDLDVLDPTAERFTGTIPSARMLEVLGDPHVQTILFAPSGYTYPDSPDKGVPVRVMLYSGLPIAAQQLFHLQALAQLEQLGFREALGYDTRGYSQLKGTIPHKNLNRLVKDLRTEPAGWFVIDTPPDRLPRPFVDRNPVRWVEVMPAVEAPPPFAPELVLPARATLTPDLRAMLVNPAMKETPVRVVVLFAQPIADRGENLHTRLLGAYGPTAKRNADGSVAKGPDGLPALTEGASLDGVIGNLASIRFDRPADAERFAAEPGVLSVRLPREVTETIAPLPANMKATPAKDVLQASGLETMHRLGYTGAGVKVLVVGSDFSGYEKLIGNALPKKTRLLDLTTELDPAILPSPTDPNRVGNGLAAARACALAAPDAELVLLRIDPGAIFQLFGVIQIIRGEVVYTQAMRSRLTDIATKTTELNRRKEAAIAEYRIAFEDLADDDVTRARRVRAKAALDAIIVEQAELVKRSKRFNEFQSDVLTSLAGTRVIVNTLELESGFPLDSVSLLSRTLEQLAVPLQPRVMRRPGDPHGGQKPPLVWVQASSTSGPSVWGGPFTDVNRNGTMEFALPDRPLPPMNWTPEMNFLGVQAATGETTPEILAGAKLRFTIQWREPLDPNLPSVGVPAFPVVLRLFRQLDPNGEKQPSDEMAEMARSVGGPHPITLTKTFVVYEQILEFTVPVTGHYALVVATGYQPDPLLPALRRDVEIYPRIIVETLTAKPGEGRVVFQSYTNPDAGVGIPGDSAGVTTVGTGTPGELRGGGTGLTLRMKPDLFGPGALDTGGTAVYGTGLATGYVGGMAALLVQSGVTNADVFRMAGFKPGKAAIVPETWMKYLRPAPKPQR